MKNQPQTASVLGRLVHDPIGKALGFEYFHFDSPIGIKGLCRIDGKRVQFLVVDSVRPGHGLFRDFIAAVKLEFDRIDIWHVYSHILFSCLPRYGFRPWQEKQFVKAKNTMEHLEGYRWDK